ncbi:hypothetical protein PHLGIDRAFT_102447 [Phlebiopsis gigantea 11061_1 CR5-6]|uniref:mRNA-capping enzyme subunit beta n=1 Tax=Phlebiopsis gigantea (strain 11061_1 CR5-6) TaxID=745531 RepID=A0A0C3PR92_PHLG1|nr:hypothetical protein PHLGIDRAFT_102447 [Phlebiopsis gigantea 11061_1 CR5-6]
MDQRGQSPDADYDGQRPSKRARRTPPPVESNGHTDRPPLSLSILAVEPVDEFILEVADFIHHHIMNKKDREGTIEVEAKVGILRENGSGTRVNLPVIVETILHPEYKEYHFESNMSPMQHRHFNTLLNKLKLASSQPGHPSSPLEYTHLHLVDTFYPAEGSGNKIRVTRDEKTKEVVACMQKKRLASLDIISPKRNADWRISVNVEVPVQMPIGTATFSRRKDRMSYTHEEFIIDLTQVTSTSGPNVKPEILHELEVELARPTYLFATALKRGDPNVPEAERSAFDELIRAFVNNARILVRNAPPDGWQ